MAEFDMRQFAALLRIVPEEKPMVERPEHNEYLDSNPEGFQSVLDFFDNEEEG